MTRLDEFDPRQTYSVLLESGGPVIGTLIYPLDKTSTVSKGGYPIVHRRVCPSAAKGKLHVFTVDVGIGVYEVLIPLDRIVAMSVLPEVEESIIHSPEDPLWQQLDASKTWRIPLARVLVDATTKVVKAEGLSFRPVVELPHVASFPHPVSFPRFAPFKPKRPLLLYFNAEVMSRYFPGLEDDQGVFRLFGQHSATPLGSLTDQHPDAFVFTEGAIGFFAPPQTVTWRGQPAQLVAITREPFSEGELGHDWLLGCVYANAFPFFQESIERLACTYQICGELLEAGPFECEHGTRRHVLYLGAAAHLDESSPHPDGEASPFELGEYHPLDRPPVSTSSGVLKRRIANTTDTPVATSPVGSPDRSQVATRRISGGDISLWVRGLFFLLAFCVVVAGIAVLSRTVSAWALPVVVVASILLYSVVGAFLLRTHPDHGLSENGFLSLMSQSLAIIPKLLQGRGKNGRKGTQTEKDTEEAEQVAPPGKE